MRIDEVITFDQAFEWIRELINNENTITKLEEEGYRSEGDIMKEEIKSMKTLEACAYLQDHEDEYLVAKDDDEKSLYHSKKSELHYDGKKFHIISTIYNDSLMFQYEDQTVGLDEDTNNIEWIKVEKPKKLCMYMFIGYINNELIHLSKEEHESNCDTTERKNQIHKKLDKIAHKNFDAFGGIGNCLLFTIPYSIKIECFKILNEDEMIKA